MVESDHLALHVSAHFTVVLGYAAFILVLIYIVLKAGSRLLRLIYERMASMI